MKKVKVFCVNIIGSKAVCKYKKGGFILTLTKPAIEVIRKMYKIPGIIAVIPELEVKDIEFLPGLTAGERRKLKRIFTGW